MTSVERVVYDCDPGIDDAIALLLAVASPEIDLRAVTVSYGNVALSDTIRNALVMRELADASFPVYAGADRPLLRDVIDAVEVHGAHGLGLTGLPEPTSVAHPGRAVDAIINEALAAPGEVTIVATGAMTNVALALRLEPRLRTALKRIVFMGGSTGAGNTTPAAEFNIYADPHAAKIMIESGVPLTMIGLNLTHQVLITPDRIASIRSGDNRVAAVSADLLEHYTAAYKRIYGRPAAALHDPCAIAFIVAPNLFETELMHVEVYTNDGPNLGRTVCDIGGTTGRSPNVDVAVSVDAARLLDLLVKRLGRVGARGNS